jgi:hypothetical protein
MANNNSTSVSGGSGFMSLLAVLFIGLKLGGVIDWSWWWVLAPIWGSFALLAVMLVVFFGVAIVQRMAER